MSLWTKRRTIFLLLVPPLALWISCATGGGSEGAGAPPRPPSSEQLEGPLRFRVLTFNTLKFGGQVPPERVMDRMLELEPDVLLLQEVFNTRRIKNDFRALNARRLLTRRLEDDYHVVWLGTSGPSGFLRVLTLGRYRDGLMIAARKDRWDFDRRTGHHTLRLPTVGKYNLRGVQAALLVRRGGSQRVLIANTHLTRGAEETHGEVRREQARALRRFVGDLERSTRADGVVLGGDFNAHESDPLIRSLAESGDAGAGNAPGEEAGLPTFRDAFREAEPAAPGLTFDVANTLVGDRPEGSERIDYLWLRPLDPNAFELLSVRVVLDRPDEATGQNLSDHYGVLAELELTPP